MLKKHKARRGVRFNLRRIIKLLEKRRLQNIKEHNKYV